MKSIRIGKDINLAWTITIDGVSRDLAGLDLTLFLHDDVSGECRQMDFTTSFDTLRFTFAGTEQKHIGVYRATLWLNKGKSGQAVLDDSTAFRLVPRTEMEGGTDDNVQTESVALSGDMTTGGVVPQDVYDRLDDLEEDMERVPTEVAQEDASMVEFVRGTKRCYTIGCASATRAGVMSARQATELQKSLADIEELKNRPNCPVYDFSEYSETEDIDAEGWQEFKRKFNEVSQGKAVGYYYGCIVFFAQQMDVNQWELYAAYDNGSATGQDYTMHYTRCKWVEDSGTMVFTENEVELARRDYVPNAGAVENGNLVMKSSLPGKEKNLFSVPLPAQEPFYKILQTGASDVRVSPRSSKNVQYDMGLPEGYELGAYLAIGVSQATSGGNYRQIVIKQFATAGGNTKCNITLYNEDATEEGVCNLTIKMLAVNTKFKG